MHRALNDRPTPIIPIPADAESSSESGLPSIETTAATNGTPSPRCRFCGATLTETFVDLGMSPLCESFVTKVDLGSPEIFYPLHVRVCLECFLVQLPAFVEPDEIFTEYAYFASYSDSWVRHAQEYATEISERLQLSAERHVIEIASNDGYLLRHFDAMDIPVLGVEPARNVAGTAIADGIPTVTEFFGEELARELALSRRADLLIANNVLAQVPDLNDFVRGLEILLADDGVLTAEFPHLGRLIEDNQFDTIYHEHFSYFSLTTLRTIFARHGLRIFDVERHSTHGGSLRVFACRAGNTVFADRASVSAVLESESAAGLDNPIGYAGFQRRVEDVKHALVDFLIQARRQGRSVAGYGAPGKGNTLLNFCGIRSDLLPYTVDRNPYKQGRFLPGTRIPIYHPSRLAETKPDYILLLPWNLRTELATQLNYARSWGAELVVPIPSVEVVSP